MINNQLIIAKRYAQAFLNVFSLTDADIKNITHAIDFLKQNSQISAYLKIPLLDSQIKSEALKESIVTKFDLPSSFNVMIEVLVRKKRSELLLHVLEQVKSYYQEQHAIKPFIISSSVELTDTQKKLLEEYLIRATGVTVDTHYDIDKTLIAGIRMQNNELQWEYSIAQQLKKIRASLLG